MFGLFVFMGHALNYVGIASLVYALRMQKLEKEGKDTSDRYANITAATVAIAWPFILPFLVVATVLTYKENLKTVLQDCKDTSKFTWNTPPSSDATESAFDELRS